MPCSQLTGAPLPGPTGRGISTVSIVRAAGHGYERRAGGTMPPGARRASFNAGWLQAAAASQVPIITFVGIILGVGSERSRVPPSASGARGRGGSGCLLGQTSAALGTDGVDRTFYSRDVGHGCAPARRSGCAYSCKSPHRDKMRSPAMPPRGSRARTKHRTARRVLTQIGLLAVTILIFHTIVTFVQ
eukprot:scaffold582_cov385-Prasinococcus_capsulatus_cf.AAC.29